MSTSTADGGGHFSEGPRSQGQCQDECQASRHERLACGCRACGGRAGHAVPGVGRWDGAGAVRVWRPEGGGGERETAYEGTKKE